MQRDGSFDISNFNYLTEHSSWLEISNWLRDDLGIRKVFEVASHDGPPHV